MQFANRQIAGMNLGRKLAAYGENTVIIAIPRGGVPVAKEIASAIHAPLQIVITRKIGHPHQPEFAVCAVTESHHTLCDERIKPLIDKAWLAEAIEREYQESQRRRVVYGIPPLTPDNITGKKVILVDDGIATGLTMKAAVAEITSYHPEEIIIAAPVISKEANTQLKAVATRVIALHIPDYFGAVGLYYQHFPQLTDTEVNMSLTPH